ncbi:MAG: hypothetical protein ACFCUQ_18250 [Kiloniellales bacterium]
MAASTARGGHEAPLYPSYYPQEIRIEAVAPSSAARLLEEGGIQAYLGAEPEFAGPVPDSLRYVESLGSFLVVRVNASSPRAQPEDAMCGLVRSLLTTLSADPRGFVLHPYPITAVHADYLHHADLAAAARARLLEGPAAPLDGLRVRAEGAEAERLVRGLWPGEEAEWDVSLEVVDAAGLVAAERFAINGWLGPPWLKEGWFHASLLLAPALDDPGSRERVERLVARLQTDAPADETERLNLERELLGLLTASCRAIVAGYSVKREYYSDAYSEGIENIAHDSHAGLNAPIFLRTVKLKDFPWNGWLRLGVPEPPQAAWNPFAGFGDEAGRLIWSAIGDPALFPEPYSDGWILNRIGEVQEGNER